MDLNTEASAIASNDNRFKEIWNKHGCTQTMQSVAFSILVMAILCIAYGLWKCRQRYSRKKRSTLSYQELLLENDTYIESILDPQGNGSSTSYQFPHQYEPSPPEYRHLPTAPPLDEMRV